MVVINEYTLERKVDSECYYVRSGAVCDCPFCDGKLRPIGSRHRKVRRWDDSTIILIIRRLRCDDCLRIHHELPDRIVPYKRYDAETIERIISTASVPDSAGTGVESVEETVICSACPDYPCELSTALRLIEWFLRVLTFLKDSYHSREPELLQFLQIQSVSINALKNLPSGWMRKISRLLILVEHTRFA